MLYAKLRCRRVISRQPMFHERCIRLPFLFVSIRPLTASTAHVAFEHGHPRSREAARFRDHFSTEWGIMTSDHFGPLSVNDVQATVGREPLLLPRLGHHVLRVLVRAKGALVSYDRILKEVWPTEPTNPSKIKVHISRLRARLKPHGITIRTARGLGSYLVCEAVPVRGLLVIKDASGGLLERLQRTPNSAPLEVARTPAAAIDVAAGPWSFAILDQLEERELVLRALRRNNLDAVLIGLTSELDDGDRRIARELGVDFLLPGGGTLERILEALATAQDLAPRRCEHP